MNRKQEFTFQQEACVNERQLPAGCWPLDASPAAEVPPLELGSPSVMSAAELAAWTQTGRNGIARLTAHFGIRELTGNAKNHRFSAHEVVRKITGAAPRTAAEMQELLKPLQKASWVSAVTGLSISAINAAIRGNQLLLPAPLELTRTGSEQAAPRGRRWIPAQLEAYLLGAPVPFLPQDARLDGPGSPPLPGPGNVFAAICAGNAGTSRQRQR